MKGWKYNFNNPSSVYGDVLTFQSFQELIAQPPSGLAGALCHSR